MREWLTIWWRRLTAWRAANVRKFADAPESPCCSHPPAGAGQEHSAGKERS